MVTFDGSSGAITVAITGASGSFGQALLRAWSRQPANGQSTQLVALTSGQRPLDLRDAAGKAIPVEQATWQIGQESALRPLLERVDLLVLNHGINHQQARSREATDLALEVNALSSWRLLELFADVVRQRPAAGRPRPEVWINTSEAEIQPAFSPLYELSKRLLGNLVSLRALDLASPGLRIRRLVLGPFRSALNPIGVMGADFVAREVVRQAGWNLGLVIVTPNPLTYLLMPLACLGRWLYFQATSKRSDQPAEAL